MGGSIRIKLMRLVGDSSGPSGFHRIFPILLLKLKMK